MAVIMVSFGCPVCIMIMLRFFGMLACLVIMTRFIGMVPFFLFHAFHNFQSLTGLYGHQLGPLGTVDHLLRPALHTCTIIDKHIGGGNLRHILCRRLPVMRLDSGRNQCFHIGQVADNIFGELIHRVKADLDIQLVCLDCSSSGGRLCGCG
ncbi:hypothetical protein D3C75_935580 [compost metagenome]